MADELAQRLATAARLLHHEGHLNYSGHISARLPDGGLLIHTYDSDRAAVRPEELLRCTLDGQPVSGSDSAAGRPPLEVFIHTEIYRARPACSQ
jgi:ribulose-5-phosphate 4-epimerase/fuculose-1-phosphate aldolase